MPKLTKRVVDAVEVRASEYFIWDNDIPGFGVRVLPSGRKTFILLRQLLRFRRQLRP